MMEEKYRLPFCSWMQSCTGKSCISTFSVFSDMFAGPRFVKIQKILLPWQRGITTSSLCSALRELISCLLLVSLQLSSRAVMFLTRTMVFPSTVIWTLFSRKFCEQNWIVSSANMSHGCTPKICFFLKGECAIFSLLVSLFIKCKAFNR